jgi:methylated-DNA-[protein]-cysteine S-methyltransferase
MHIETPFGPAWASVNGAGELTAFGFGEPTKKGSGENPEVARQLAEYFAGTRQVFDLALAPEGSAFQRQVWEELKRIGYGETITYAELAKRVGHPGAARAVGRANATNPIALVIPCHRVIGRNGKLTGYAYGIALKEQLLNWERRVWSNPLFQAASG